MPSAEFASIRRKLKSEMSREGGEGFSKADGFFFATFASFARHRA
jgi:hypothetical protein